MFRMRSEHFYPSSDKDDLIAKPYGAHKFGSLEILASPTTTTISRQTYSILEWLGDVGGLNDSLFVIVKLILGSFTSFYNSSFMTREIFRFQKKVSNQDSYANKTDKESILKAKALQKTAPIEYMTWLRFCLCRFSKQRQAHQKLLAQAQSKLDKEMDLKRFITR